MQTLPFRIQVEQAVLDDLRSRLKRSRWVSVVESPNSSKPAAKETNWKLGTSTGYLRELVNYWLTGYHWRQHEAALNELRQFKTHIDNARLHYVYVEGRGSSPMPLLLLHGWPDSFYRFHKVVPKLSERFDVVVPSLPGFAFTGEVKPASQKEPNRQTATLLWKLMTEVLGYRQFAVAGGDGGSVIAQIMAIDHPDNVIGIHLTDLGWHATNIDPSLASKEEQKYLATAKKRFTEGGAYAMVQTTRPRSLAAGLSDSPVGLASWIVDRFHSWCDGDIEQQFDRDDLLTNIMLYWITRTIGSSMFTYYADMRSPSLTVSDYVDVPVGLALFPKDGSGFPPRSLAERTLNVQRYVEMPRGGHFAALEEPELYAEDVSEFFELLRPRTADLASEALAIRASRGQAASETRHVH